MRTWLTLTLPTLLSYIIEIRHNGIIYSVSLQIEEQCTYCTPPKLKVRFRVLRLLKFRWKCPYPLMKADLYIPGRIKPDPWRVDALDSWGDVKIRYRFILTAMVIRREFCVSLIDDATSRELFYRLLGNVAMRAVFVFHQNLERWCPFCQLVSHCHV